MTGPDAGVELVFHVYENRRHGGALLYEWLLESAKKLGLRGGSAFRAIAGFGRHGVLHEQHFFELAGEVPVAVVFVLSDDEAERLLQCVRQERLSVFFVRRKCEYGVTV